MRDFKERSVFCLFKNQQNLHLSESQRANSMCHPISLLLHSLHNPHQGSARLNLKQYKAHSFFHPILFDKNVLHVRLEYILTTNKIRGFNFLQSLCAKVICNVRTFNDTIYLVASVAV